MSAPGRVLVMAKAPRPGAVKTRLAADVGAEEAAALAAAALLDTLEACGAAFAECHLALEGALEDAVDGGALSEAAAHWQVFPQSAGGLGDRLADAHRRVAASGTGPVVQVGMDTPQVTPGLLRAVAGGCAAGRAVLGPAEDGGWWALGLVDGVGASALPAVPMSTSTTGALTRSALSGAGLTVQTTTTLRDVDTLADARIVAAQAPQTRFAAAWRRVGGTR